MLQQFSPGLNPKPLDQFSLRFRYPSELFKPLIECIRCSLFAVHRSLFSQVSLATALAYRFDVELQFHLALVIIRFQVKSYVPGRIR